MFGTVPGDLVDFFDFTRFAELCCDGSEVPVTTVSALNALPRAINLVGAAENQVAMAVRQRATYTLQELRDLVRDYHLPAGTISGTGADAHLVGISGQQLITIIADLAWAGANRRRRYAKGSPQEEDPSRPEAEERLNLLREGSRIFVLDGVEVWDGDTWTGTWYGPEVSEAGIMVGGSIIDYGLFCKPRMWGCKTGSVHSPRVSSNPCCD